MGQRCPPPFAADPVSSFPDHDQRLADRLIVDAPALFYRRLLLSVVAGLPQQPDAMLAMVAGHRDELVQDLAFLLWICGTRYDDGSAKDLFSPEFAA